MHTPIALSDRIQPGEWLGMLGGGQLGRMFCHEAQKLGYKVVVLDPSGNSPAGMVAERHMAAAYDDIVALRELAAITPAVTTEFENVPASSLKQLSASCRVTPGAAAVAVVQDRIAEKAFISAQDIPVAPYCEVREVGDLEQAQDALFPGILKVARLGYDGKGQQRVSTRAEAVEAFRDFGQIPCVLEAMLPLDYEISVVMARAISGETAIFPIGINTHENGILASTVVAPELINEDLARQAREAALRIAEGLNYQGVLCVEFFVLSDGRLIANEIAPRPHNSGHYTMDACVTSQFEQQVRVMTGMPLGATDLLTPVVMLNILGDCWFNGNASHAREPQWHDILAIPGVSLHLYGKDEPRPGRKVGHINVVGATIEQAKERARDVIRKMGIRTVLS